MRPAATATNRDADITLLAKFTSQRCADPATNPVKNNNAADEVFDDWCE
jgi:hypothetical protein